MTDRQERAMSFGSIAEDYDGLRPHPPQQAVDWLLPSRCEVAVDVGAGTGVYPHKTGTSILKVTARCVNHSGAQPD